MEQIIGNQQDYIFTNKQIQVLLTGTFGDGCISYNKSGTSVYTTNCIHKEYINYKKDLLGDLFSSQSEGINQGYKQNMIYKLLSKCNKQITQLHNLSLEDKLEKLDELGLALWFYDDGSLHKNRLFFNLNTHSFNEEVHNDVLMPFFKKLGFSPKVFKDKKKDGRVFSYLYFGKHFGAYEIMQILQKYPVECFKYKIWSSETIQKWSRLQAQLKSEDRKVTPRMFEEIILGRSFL
jgi:hypothetical protein